MEYLLSQNETKRLLSIISDPCWKDIYFTADTHFGHKRILEITERKFDSIEEHDQKIIDNWNDRVTDRDLVIHLGDFAFKRPTYYRGRLNGELIVIEGNHDNLPRTKFNVLRDYVGQIRGNMFHLYHYPVMAWCSSHYGSYHLHGHVHGLFRYLPFRSLDVGIDCHDLAPIKFEKALKMIDLKNNLGEKSCA